MWCEMRKFVGLTAGGLLALVLSACGFHLQGHTPLPDVVKSPFVQTTDRQSEFAISLERAMIISGAHPTE